MSDTTKQRRTRKYVYTLLVDLVYGPMYTKLIAETDLTPDTISSMCRDATDAAITFYDEKKEHEDVQPSKPD